MKRRLRVRVDRRRGARTAEELAAWLTDYVQGKTNEPPTLRLTTTATRKAA